MKKSSGYSEKKDIIYNIALIPDHKFGKKLIKESQILADQLPSKYILGKNSIPHCTLIQFSSKKDPKDIWNSLSTIKTRKIKTKLLRYYNNTSTSGKRWFGIEVKLSDDLKKLQAAYLRQIKPKKIHNKIKDTYFPHFTLGMVLNKNTKFSFKNKNLIKIRPECEIHLCKSGSYYTAMKILH
jgi:2'-5' RNA ligase